MLIKLTLVDDRGMKEPVLVREDSIEFVSLARSRYTRILLTSGKTLEVVESLEAIEKEANCRF
jgi:hypothetical protein